MNCRALLVFSISLLILAGLQPTTTTGSAAMTLSTMGVEAKSLGASQSREPAKGQTGASKERSRSLVHKENGPGQAPAVESSDMGSQSFGVVIGISVYKNLPPKSQLQFADRDATAIRDFLVGPNGGFKPENVDLLVNDQASQASIFRALGKLQNRASTRDLAFIFFAGHGFVNSSNQGFVLANDSKPDDLVFTAVEMDRFNSLIKNLRARSVVIMTDACHSGTIGDLQNQGGSSESVVNLSVKNFAEASGRKDQTSFILSAASPTQSSWEMGALQHGLFTYHVLEALSGKADRNQNGVVTSDELYDYVMTNVRRDAEQQGHSQVPEYNPRYDRSIPLAVLNDAGQKLYKEWFDSDPFFSKNQAFFYEALKTDHLIKPELDSAWDYYNTIKANAMGTPPEVVRKMRDELLEKLISSSQSVIDLAPSDPLVWEEAASRLGRAHELSLEKPLRAKQAFCTAMAAHRSGENGRAEREGDTALQQIKDANLKEPLLCFKIAQLYNSLRKIEKAREGYKLAIEGDPRVDWICEYAEVLKQLKDLAEADSQLRFARKTDPRDYRVLRLLAEVLVLEDRREQFGEAVDIAREARQLKQNDVDIEGVFGWALLKAGRPAEARDPLRKVAELRLSDESQRDPALLRLSQAYAQTGDLDRSVSALREAERQGSKLPEIYDELSLVLEQQGELDGAIAAAEKASAYVQSTGQEKATRVRRLAECLERVGRISEAELQFRNAARSSADVKVSGSLDAHANVLSYRAQRFQEAPPQRKRAATSRLSNRGTELLIIPGGREPLKRLTGVAVEPGLESQALAVIFESCLRDKQLQARLVRFYEKYPELLAKFQGKGIGLSSGSITLPAAGQAATPAATEVLAFLGVKDKNGRREIEKKELEAKAFILEALGGDAQRLQRGETTQIKLGDNSDISIPLGMERWVQSVKDIQRDKSLTYFLAFLKDEHAMRLFAGIAALPDNAVDEFFDRVTTKETWKELDSAIHFAAPFLRFTPDGQLHVPGEQQGRLNWQQLLKVNSFDSALRALFKKDNSEALYVFAALSNAGEVGDFIARSPMVGELLRALKDSPLPDTRESFDLIDLLTLVRVEDRELRLPHSIELWLTAERTVTERKAEDRKDTDRKNAGHRSSDPIAAMLAAIGKSKAGRSIPSVRLMAALAQIERERPDWVSDISSIDAIVKLLNSSRESQLELALDLQMSRQQLGLYLSRITRVDAISTPALKQATACVYQSTLELLRIPERNGVVKHSKIAEAVNLLLDLDPGSDQFAAGVMAGLRTTLLDTVPAVSGSDFEKQLIALLAQTTSFALHVPAASGGARNAGFYQMEASKPAEERIAHNLGIIQHTRLRAVINAATALDTLEKSASDTAGIQRLKDALSEFVESAPPPPPKKTKSKEPVVSPPTAREIAAQLSAPIQQSSVEELRRRILPALAQALLGAVYAAESNVSEQTEEAYNTLVLNHDMSTDAWANTQLDPGRKSARGGLGRLGYVLTSFEAALMDQVSQMAGAKPSAVAPKGSSDDQSKSVLPSPSKHPASALLTVTILNSYRLANQRWETTRAAEFISRSIDLGEEVLGMHVRGDQTARALVDQLDQQLTPRRAQVLRAYLDSSEIKRALVSLSLSEIYSIGQRYFAMRTGAQPIASLVSEPGALGAMARSIGNAPENALQEDLRREIRQFGMTMETRTGLMRLDLRELEAYEQSLTVGETTRLIERLQDFKLALARACYRRGHSPALAFSPELVGAALQSSLVEMEKVGGRMPPDRDWRNVLNAIQVFDENALNAFVEKLITLSYASPVAGVKWNDQMAGVQ